eukprot:COSAG02_NODE_3604_length_6492_cov_3.323166_8_plen_617_part_00
MGSSTPGDPTLPGDGSLLLEGHAAGAGDTMEPERPRDDAAHTEAVLGRTVRVASLSSPPPPPAAAKRRPATLQLSPPRDGSSRDLQSARRSATLQLSPPRDSRSKDIPSTAAVVHETPGCCSGVRRVSRARLYLGALALVSPLTLALATIVALGADDVVGAIPRVFEFARSISLSMLVLHTAWFDEMLVDPHIDESTDAMAPEGVQCAVRWPTTGRLARLFGCAAPSGETDAASEDPKSRRKGLPDATLSAHFVLYAVVLAAYPAFRTTRSTGEQVTTFYRAQTTGIKLLLVLAGFWLAIQVRRAVLGVATDQHSVRRVSSLVVRAMAASIFVQLCLLCKFLIWHGETEAAVRAAIDNGFPRENLDGQRDVFFSLVNLSGAVGAISLWLAVTVSLGLFDNDVRHKYTLGRTLPVQLMLMGVLLVSCAIAFMWVDSELSKGSRRYQLADAAGVVLGSCNATCDLSPPLTVVLCSASLGLQYVAQGECSIDVQVNIILMICGTVTFLLLGYDIHCQDTFNQKLKLPAGKRFHFFLCHHQGSGGAQCAHLYHQLTSRGCKVWYDNEQPSEERVEAGMQRGVKNSMTLLIFLSGRRESFVSFSVVSVRTQPPGPARNSPV